MYDVILFQSIDYKDHEEAIIVASALGIPRLASVLRKHGYSTLTVRHASHFSLDEFKRLIDLSVSEQTKVVGISTTFTGLVEETDNGNVNPIGPFPLDVSFPRGKEFENECIAYIKSKNPNVKILLGGAMSSPKCSNTNIDYAFIGYSEGSLVNLLNHLTLGEELKFSSVNEFGVTIVDDRLGSLYDFTSDQMIWEKTDVVNLKVLTIEVGRGCIFKCSYCNFPLRGKKKLDFIKDTQLLYDELLDNYERYGITHYLITDDTFNDHIEKLKTINNAVKQLPFQPKFWCFARLDLMTAIPETVELMYSIGVRGISIGLETLNEEAGKTVGKGFSREKQLAMLDHIKSTYPDVSIHALMMYGLPKESEESLHNTSRMLISGEVGVDSWSIKPVFIQRETDVLNFSNDLNLNYEKFGYEDTGIRVGPTSPIIMWKNDHTTFQRCAQIADKTMTESLQSPYFKIKSPTAFNMVNLGYDLDYILKIPYREFDWSVLKQQEIEFINEYKAQLFEILEEEKSK